MSDDESAEQRQTERASRSFGALVLDSAQPILTVLVDWLACTGFSEAAPAYGACVGSIAWFRSSASENLSLRLQHIAPAPNSNHAGGSQVRSARGAQRQRGEQWGTERQQPRRALNGRLLGPRRWVCVSPSATSC